MITSLWGNSLNILPTIQAKSIQCCITSPPYYLLRDYSIYAKYPETEYDTEDVYQLGQETTVNGYIAHLMLILVEVHRVLRDDGILWLNLGDTYIRKHLMGIPWRVALSLQNCGWVLRSSVIWEKTNTMPESVKDRPTRSHEYIFMLTKSTTYYYDWESIAEPVKVGYNGSQFNKGKTAQAVAFQSPPSDLPRVERDIKNKRDVWSFGTAQYKDAHFAVFPETLVRTCMLAGSRENDTVLDPFAGSGTVGKVAQDLHRNAILIELNEDYKTLQEERIKKG